jgi:hypothetical protein
MTHAPDASRAAVEQRFAQATHSSGQKKRFPFGHISAKKLAQSKGERKP